jgi:hypothetical protein
MRNSNYPQDDPAPDPDPVSRPRVGTRLWDKLNVIEELIRNRSGSSTSVAADGDSDTTPTVSFEPDPADLPVVAGDEPEAEGEITENGEGTANLAFEKAPRYRFPHRHRVEVEVK